MVEEIPRNLRNAPLPANMPITLLARTKGAEEKLLLTTSSTFVASQTPSIKIRETASRSPKHVQSCSERSRSRRKASPTNCSRQPVCSDGEGSLAMRLNERLAKRCASYRGNRVYIYMFPSTVAMWQQRSTRRLE